MATQFSFAPCEVPMVDDGLYAYEYFNDKFDLTDKFVDDFGIGFESFDTTAFDNLQQFQKTELKPTLSGLNCAVTAKPEATRAKSGSNKRRKSAEILEKSRLEENNDNNSVDVREEVNNKRRSKSFAVESSDDTMSVDSRKSKRPRSSSDSELSYDLKSLRAPLWSEDEEVFLVGAVMKRFFKYGSLASARKTENDVWESIKENFDQAVVKYGTPGQTPRSKNALSRHYKFMKSNSNPRFYELWKLWEQRYGSL